MNGIYWTGMLLLVAADQALKLWAEQVLALSPGGQMPLWPGIVGLQYVRNTGAAFSMLAEHTLLLTVVCGAMLAAVLFYLMREKHLTPLTRIAGALIVSGGVGNCIDRARLGYVIDYVQLQFVRFAIFNLADALICVGAGLLCVALLRKGVGNARGMDR